eukprot:2478704-Pleurochrysis_carterae.AAC.5
MLVRPLATATCSGRNPAAPFVHFKTNACVKVAHARTGKRAMHARANATFDQSCKAAWAHACDHRAAFQDASSGRRSVRQRVVQSQRALPRRQQSVWQVGRRSVPLTRLLAGLLLVIQVEEPVHLARLVRRLQAV